VLPLQTFTGLVQQFAAAAQGSAIALLDFTVGSISRALAEGCASIALWLQWIAVQILQMTRAATSQGAALDSWMADFSLTRLPAVPAVGPVTFSRFTPSASALVPVGAQVKTADGSRIFAVIVDTSNSLWNAAQNGFFIPAGTASGTCTVQDVTTDSGGNLSVGSAGNVSAGAISLLASAIPGIDTVTNPVAFTNGIDAETDAAFRARFANYIQTRSLATDSAVAYAIQSVQQGLQFTIQENVTPGGAGEMGNFVVTVDDGSGNPPSSLLSEVYAAVNGVRPVGSTFTVQGPGDLSANIAFTLTTNPISNKPNLVGPLTTAIDTYIDTLPVGATLAFTRLAAVIYGVDPSITNVTNLQINSGTSDIVPTQSQVVKAGTVVIS
jgi:uncharacterized phage protein gp47/JayE